MPNASLMRWGVIMNWLALGTSFLASFFVSPLLVSHLGNVAYGVWTLVNSLVSYMSLLDLGLRGAVTRYVSRDHSLGQHSEVSATVSTALWFRLRIVMMGMLVWWLLAALSPKLFIIPPEMQLSARLAIGISVVTFAMNLTLGIFGGVLVGLHRFDLVSAVTGGQTVLRAVGVVGLLRSGHGIVALAVWEFLVAALANILFVRLSFRLCPQLKIQHRRPDARIGRQLWGYGVYAFIINCAVSLVYYTDNLVIGAFLSAQAVTFYAIGGSLIESLRQLVSALSVTFSPLASSLEAKSQDAELRRLLIYGTRTTLFIGLPVMVALFFRGRTFIGLWMGPQYAEVSGRVLEILLISQVFAIAGLTSSGIAYGVSKHQRVAMWSSVEGVANLVLSVVLVQPLGLVGVAWGTVIPSLALQLLFWPGYVCRLVAIPVRYYLWQAWIRPGLSMIPFAGACYFGDQFWQPAGMFQFLAQIGAALPLVLIGASICFWKEVRAYLAVLRSDNESIWTSLTRRSPP